MRREAILSFVAIVLLASASFAATVLVTGTKVASTTVTWPIILPNGQTTTLTVPLTTTLTYTNTSIGKSEMIAHVFNPACAPLAIPTMVIRWDETPHNVGDSWQIVYVISDRANHTAVATVTTLDGKHNVTISEFVGGRRVQHTITMLSNESLIHPGMLNINGTFKNDFGMQEFTDFYSDGDGIQFFWYGPHAAFIATSVSSILPVIFAPTDIAVFFAPLIQGQALLFKPFALNYFFVGQQSGVPTEVPVTSAFNSSPCTNLNAQASVSDTNFCETIQSYQSEGGIPIYAIETGKAS